MASAGSVTRNDSEQQRADRPARSVRSSAGTLKTLFAGPLIRNAASLYGTTIVTSGLGFLYWLVAARLAPVRAVGTASAVQSATQVISVVCVLGLNTVLIAELPGNAGRARSLIATAVSASAACAFVVSLATAEVLRLVSPNLRPALTGATGPVLFVSLGVAATVLLILDNASIGLLRGDLQLKRNTIFAVSKLLVLPGVIVLWSTASGKQLETAWLTGLVLSAGSVVYWLWRSTVKASARPAFSYLRSQRRLVFGHYALNLSVAAPGFVVPVLVATIVGPAANARYTAAMLIAGFVSIIPYQLSTVLFAIAPGDEGALRREARKTLSISLAVGCVSVPALFLLAGFILGIFGGSYTGGATALSVLALRIFPSSVIAHYVAIARIRRRMRQAAIWTSFGAAAEMGFAAVGGVMYGITGVAMGVLAALVIEAVWFLPTLASLRGPVPVPADGRPPASR